MESERVVGKDGATIAVIIRQKDVDGTEKSTVFHSLNSDALQVGTITLPCGKLVQPHYHPKHERSVIGTAEVLIVKYGSVMLYLYDDKDLIKNTTLWSGDIVALLSGGHGLEAMADSQILEVKQGPYLGVEDKRPLRLDAGEPCQP